MSDLRRYSSRFAALGHEVRLEILRRLRRRIRTGWSSGRSQHFGKDSEKLIEFGLQPFRGSRTAAPKPTLPPDPAK